MWICQTCLNFDLLCIWIKLKILSNLRKYSRKILVTPPPLHIFSHPLFKLLNRNLQIISNPYSHKFFSPNFNHFLPFATLNSSQSTSGRVSKSFIPARVSKSTWLFVCTTFYHFSSQFKWVDVHYRTTSSTNVWTHPFDKSLEYLEPVTVDKAFHTIFLHNNFL